VPARSTIEYELPMEPLKQNAYVLRASARKSREKRFLARQQRIKTHQRYLVLGLIAAALVALGAVLLIPLPDDPSEGFTRGTFAAYLMTAWLIALYVVYFRYRTLRCDVSGLRTDYKRSCPASGILGKGFSRSSRLLRPADCPPR
jgi:hypothetical protein